ncbi:MAG: response regulator [Sulfurimonas sp.]|nr:response regulator [Sulfurimonas sp.]
MIIVILNDSSIMHRTIESFLKEFDIKDNEVYSFTNGYEALDFIKINGADIIFSDITMPYMDGFEFAELVFKVVPNLRNSFFAIRGDENRKNFLRMRHKGVHRFLKKPFDIKIFEYFILPEIMKVRFREENSSTYDKKQLVNNI